MARGKGTRTAKDGQVARVGGVWTADKLYYLERYAAAFTVAMRKKWDALVYIDLLAGPGKDIEKQSGREFNGSPLIALRTEPKFARVILGDRDKENVAALRARIAAADVARVDLQVTDCHERVREAMRGLGKRTLALAFVDPEGFEVGFDLLRTFSQGPVDIVMLFPSGIGITRNIAMFARAEESPLMDALWGGSTWRELPLVKAYAGRALTAGEMNQLQPKWVDAYRERVSTLGYRYSDSIGPLCNDQGAPMYHLLFFSRHEAGLTIWHGIRNRKPDGSRWLPGLIRD
jgi:three-Cys-motif partner protein